MTHCLLIMSMAKQQKQMTWLKFERQERVNGQELFFGLCRSVTPHTHGLSALLLDVEYLLPRKLILPVDGGLLGIPESVPHLGLALELVLVGVDVQILFHPRVHIEIEKV